MTSNESGSPSNGEPDNSSQHHGSMPNGKKRHELATAWISAAVGIAALILSVYNWRALQREPNVDISLPHVVRLSHGKWGADLFFQPTLSTRVKTERVEVITEVELRLRPIKAGIRQPTFFWDETGYFSDGVTSNELIYHYREDPRPLLVSQSNPQQPTLLFRTGGWNFTEGRYEGTLVLLRASEQEPLTKKFCLVISKDAITSMRQYSDYRDFRNDVPNTTRKGSTQGCYVLGPL